LIALDGGDGCGGGGGAVSVRSRCEDDPSRAFYEQLYSSASDREKKQTKTIYNKHRNTIDM